MAQKRNNTDLCAFVEKVTLIKNVGVFLEEIVSFYGRRNTDGGIAGINRVRYDYVVKSGVNYTGIVDGELFTFHANAYAYYTKLRTDDLAALLYAAAFIDIFGMAIPDTKTERYRLFTYLFDNGASLDKYMS